MTTAPSRRACRLACADIANWLIVQGHRGDALFGPLDELARWFETGRRPPVLTDEQIADALDGERHP